MLKKRFFKTKDDCEVTFELVSEGADKVALVCEANGWQPVEMKKARTGAFRAKMRLPKERDFEFRYLVDQTSWVNDDTADDYRINRYGSRNGVLSTTAAG